MTLLHSTSDSRIRSELGLPDETKLVVAVDTEGSGLHVDDGHTVSAISVAWRRLPAHDGGGGALRGPDTLDPTISALAYPFDQGRYEEKTGLNVIPGLETSHDANLGREYWNVLLEWLSYQNLIMHHAKHDLHMLNEGTRTFVGRDLSEAFYWDTMLAAWIMDPNEPIGLDAQAFTHLDRRKSDVVRTAIKESRGRYGTPGKPRYDLVPWTVISSYAQLDAELTYLLWEHQQARLETGEGHLRPHINSENDLCRVLYRMERRGIGYDSARSLQIAKKAEELAKELEGKLPFDPTPAQASGWFFDEKGAQPHCVTPGGKKSVSECCVRVLAEKGSPEVAEVAAAYQRHSKIVRSVSMWYKGYADKVGLDGRLRTDFKQTKTEDAEGNSGKTSGTVSGRLASTRVNLQAMPHDYRLVIPELPSPRSLIVPGPGKELWEMDLGQAELRVSSRVAKCERMLDLLQSGEDAHGYTAIHVLGASPDSDEWQRWRNQAKRMNFSLIYNVGPRTYRLDLEKKTGIVLSEAEAKANVQGWRKLYPEFPAANYEAERRVRQRGYVKVPGGRLRRFTEEEIRFHSSKAFNAVIQGGIAEFMKLFMLSVEERWPGMLLLQIHDSIVVEVLAGTSDIVQEMAQLGAEMATRFFDVPMIMDVKAWRG